MVPMDAVPSSDTGCPTCTVSGATNWATGASAEKPAPDVVRVEVSDPPALDVTFTTGGGAVTFGKVACPLTNGTGRVEPNPAAVSVGVSAPVSMSVLVAWTVRSWLSALYVADVIATSSWMV